MCHVCLKLTSKSVRDVVLHFYIHKQRRQSQSLVLLIPQTDVVITCVVRVALCELIHCKSRKRSIGNCFGPLRRLISLCVNI